jgi:hypothetical protein
MVRQSFKLIGGIMQKFIYSLIACSFALAAAGCGASSYHSKESPNLPAGRMNEPASDPAADQKTAGDSQPVSAFRFAIDQKEVTEEQFNQAISAELARTPVNFDTQLITVGESKLTAERKWVFLGDSATMTLSGETCKEGQTVLAARDMQNNFQRVLTAAAGMTIPFRIGKKRTFLEMPTEYEPGTLGEGYPKLQPVAGEPSLTSLLGQANKDLSYNLSIEDRKLTLTILKPTGPSQYLTVQAEYMPSGCIR